MRFGSELQRLMLMRGAGETLRSLIAQMNVTKCTKWPPQNGNGVCLFSSYSSFLSPAPAEGAGLHLD